MARIRSDLTTLDDFQRLGDVQTQGMEVIDKQYSSLREAQNATSPTFDDDSATGRFGMDMSNDFSFETLDQGRHEFWSADSDQYVKSFGMTINY